MNPQPELFKYFLTFFYMSYNHGERLWKLWNLYYILQNRLQIVYFAVLNYLFRIICLSETLYNFNLLLCYILKFWKYKKSDILKIATRVLKNSFFHLWDHFFSQISIYEQPYLKKLKIAKIGELILYSFKHIAQHPRTNHENGYFWGRGKRVCMSLNRQVWKMWQLSRGTFF